MTDPTAPFDRSFDRIAASHGFTDAELAALVDRMTERVRSYPGVHDLVYEYRRAFREDPLAARHGDAYYLCVPPRVWPEFADRVGFTDAELAAARRVHREAFEAAVSEPPDGPSDHDPLVLVA